jgi:hypothetical protein
VTPLDIGLMVDTARSPSSTTWIGSPVPNSLIRTDRTSSGRPHPTRPWPSAPWTLALRRCGRRRGRVQPRRARRGRQAQVFATGQSTAHAHQGPSSTIEASLARWDDSAGSVRRWRGVVRRGQPLPRSEAAPDRDGGRAFCNAATTSVMSSVSVSVSFSTGWRGPPVDHPNVLPDLAAVSCATSGASGRRRPGGRSARRGC